MVFKMTIISIIAFWSLFFLIFPFIFVFYRFYFFLRNPKRISPQGDDILSPADGYVLYIKKLDNDEIPVSVKHNKSIHLNELVNETNKKYNFVIGIFMTPLSVHHNRYPISGKVGRIFHRHSSGKSNKSMLKTFLHLFLKISPFTEGAGYILENERVTTLVSNNMVDCAVVQIATEWVDTIDNVHNEGDNAIKGERYGMIRFGSQCDLFVNTDSAYEIAVNVRDYVKAGETILVKM